MRIKLSHAPYISNKIAIDLLNSGFVSLDAGVEPVAKQAEIVLSEDIKKERALEERTEEILEEKEGEMQEMQIDRRDMFRLVKKKLADEEGIILSHEDRFSHVAHLILSRLIDEGLINFSVSDNRVKNIIYTSIDNYLRVYSQLESEVATKIDSYKRKLIPGTPEYDLVYERLYEEELRKKGML